jgi:hypothetical protein
MTNLGKFSSFICGFILCLIGLTTRAKSGSTVLQYIEIPGITDSDVYYALARGWLKDCQENHGS